MSENGERPVGPPGIIGRMVLDPDHCYRALTARDPRFDGRFFVGVTSTGIYCRPVCRVRMPKRANCTFFANAAAAEQAGFRPCLRCRPELAPGRASVDATDRLAQAAALALEDRLLEDESVADVASRLGVSSRHLRRVFEAAFGVAPAQYRQTQRLLLAKRLLADTRLPITEVAYASGFRSLRRFNAALGEHYRLTPTMIRKDQACMRGDDAISLELAYRPPFDWSRLLAFLGRRAIRGVEANGDGVYRRMVALPVGAGRDGLQHAEPATGWIEVAHVPARATLRVAIAPGLAGVLPAIAARVRRLFDLAADPAEIAAQLGSLATPRPGVRVPGAFEGFEVAVRAILGQQVSVAAATTLAGRFATTFGTPVATPHAGLTHVFPGPRRVAGADWREVAALGIVGARAQALVTLARAMASGELTLDPTADPAATLSSLAALPGVGPWTAQYIGMRALGWPDAFPESDLGILKALGTTRPAVARERAEAWRPWRAYAVMHLWLSLEDAASAPVSGAPKPRRASRAATSPRRTEIS
jgi:AraC family transcriptional regulator of adaptative response / DNA-3-methyladenine glycosylase II